MFLGVIVVLTQQERRIFKRLSFTSHVHITHNGLDKTVKCKDVNAEGMSLYLPDDSLKLYDNVTVRFDDHDSHFPALNADADVIRIQTIDSGFLIALEFVAIY
jgi:hypothetical protein